MKDDINLLGGNVPTNKKVPPLMLIAGGTFGVVFFIAFLTILYTLLLKIQTQNLDRSIATLNSKIAVLAVKREKIVVTNDRLSTISKIINTRRTFDEKVAIILNSIPGSFSVSGMNVNDKSMSIDLASGSLADYDSLLESTVPKLTSDKKLSISSVNMTQFQQDGAAYVATLDFNFLVTAK